jgi:hypothetical protein
MPGGKQPPRSKTTAKKVGSIVDASTAENVPVVVPLPRADPVVSDPKAEEDVTPRSPRPLGGTVPDIFVQSTLPSFISLPEDTLIRHLHAYELSFEARSRWQIPGSFLLPLILVFVVSGTFRSFGPISADTVEAFIAFCALGCLIWLGQSLTLLRHKSISATEIIERCRASMAGKNTTD